MRRATISCAWSTSKLGDFYPRSPCGERRGSGVGSWPRGIFLSTLSLRRATYLDAWKSYYLRDFYPRSPCGERLFNDILRNLLNNFYPRSPCGERPTKSDQGASNHRFLSTLSLRRATTWTRGSRITYVISIHALLAESDS